MTSLFDELSAKLDADSRLTKRGGPRVDLSLLLFNSRGELRELWHAAEASLADATGPRPSSARLAGAVEALRPIFGERAT